MRRLDHDRHPSRTERISISVTPLLKSELEAEAWSVQRTTADYVRGLLERRGKWARYVGRPGGIDIMAPECAKKKDDETEWGGR